MRIAFFGGSFDPPHLGHLAIARAAADRLALDHVLVAPVGTQPLKSELKPASFQDRLSMVELAVADDPRLVVSLADAPRVDGKPNYTVDTLTQLRGSLGPGDMLFCLLGADSFLSLKKWHRAADLLLLADFIVAGRPGFATDDIASALPLSVFLASQGLPAIPGVVSYALQGRDGAHAALYMLPDLKENISATEIRAAVANSPDAKDVLPAQVLEYIRAHGLYR